MSDCQVEIESLKDQLFEAQEEIARLKAGILWFGEEMDKLQAVVDAIGVPKK